MKKRGMTLVLILLIVVLFLGGCRKEKEEREVEEEKEVNEINEEEINDAEIPTGTAEENIEAGGEEAVEEKLDAFVKDPNNWIQFDELSLQALINLNGSNKTVLTYDDFYQGIEYQLMMEEEEIQELFGSPEDKVEDPYAYMMQTLAYNGLEIHMSGYNDRYYAMGYYIRNPDYPGPRSTKVGQSVGEILLAYPLPSNNNYRIEENQVYWGEPTEHFSTAMATISFLQDGQIIELRFIEHSGFAGVVYEINEGIVQSIYFFEMD